MNSADPVHPDALVFGEVLFDCFPDGPRLGGAPFNVACHLAALGHTPRLISRVGDDDLGREIRATMAARHMDATGLQTDPDHPTGRVIVTLDGAGGHEFHIDTDQAYDHLSPTDVRAALPTDGVRLAYFGTLCLRTTASRNAILEALDQCPGTRFLDVNLRDECWTDDTLHMALSRAHFLKINDDELAVLATRYKLPDGIADGAAALAEQFSLQGVCITCGAAGATWWTDGQCHTVPAPPVSVVDTVGAGDGFSAVMITGLLAGWPPHTVLTRAADFAAAICGQRGACPPAEFYVTQQSRWTAPCPPP